MKSSAGEAPAPGNGARNSGQQLDPRENVIEDNYHLPIRRDIKDAEMQFADGASVSRILLWAIPKQKEKAIARLVNNNRGQSPIIGCGFMEYNRQALGEEREVVVGRENGKFVSHGHRANQENGFSPFDEIRSGNEVEPPENGALASCSASPSAILWR